MSSNVFSLPRELRDQIYELVLLHQEPIDPGPWVDYNVRRELTPELLRVNKAVHREASSLFYAQNRFDFTMATPEDIAFFLERIGRNSADYIRHVRVDFPMFPYPGYGDVTLENPGCGDVYLEDDSVAIVANIRSGCPNLSTLMTSRYSTNAMELRLDALDNPKVVTEALELVNTHFRAISSLQEIIVEVYKDGPSDHIRRRMESHGWTIKAAENVEEEVEEEKFDRSFSDFEPDDDSDRVDDEYDIDNDSDFWRRAAD